MTINRPVPARDLLAPRPPFDGAAAHPHADEARHPVIGSFTDCPACASSYELAKHLPPDALRASVALRDWLLSEARHSRDAVEILRGLCERLNAAGVPVDRASLTVATLHAQHAALGHTWVKGGEVSHHAFPYDPRARDSYTRSPFFHVHETRQSLALWLPDTPDERFGIVPELKMMGYVHYLCFPIFFANGDKNGISFATTGAGGFSAADFALIHAIMPAVAAVMEISASYLTLDHVLRIYIGDEPHKRVLSGDVRRGQVSRIRSAILFADMRSYTRLTSELSPEATVELLNVYFDCLVPAIEAEGGEVLKYMGDGLLAIFRDRGDDTGAAAQAALTAAQDALMRLSAANAAGLAAVPLDAGIALHHGEAAYGNVGSGERLDFTVVGRDVNLTSRLAGLNKRLGEPLLMSRAFAEHLWADPERLGAFTLEGFAEAVDVYRPRA